MDLKNELPRVLPKAIDWAEAQQERAARIGKALSGPMREVAVRVGVRNPQSVRLVAVRELPWPEDRELQAAARETGLLGPAIIGLTLGYAVFFLAGRESVRLISHECRHVYQYEANGGIRGFLPMYLEQVLTYGYENAPLERDARDHEILSF